MVGYCYVTLASLAMTRSLGSTVTVQPGNYDDARVLVDFGEEADITSQTWRLSTEGTTEVNDWAIRLDTNSDFTFSSLLVESTIAFEVSGQKVTNGGDMFFGFGDGSQYFTMGIDFDGAITGTEDSNNRWWGAMVYPSCGGSLASGDVANVLSGSSQYDTDNVVWAVRHALAGGDYNNWHQLGGQRYDNDNTWPVTFEITNNLLTNEVTVRFHSSTIDQQCVFSGHFNTGTDLTFGVMPDTDQETFEIDEITVEKIEADVCDCDCDASSGNVNGSWTVELFGKDTLIAALCVINLVVLMAVICSRSRFGGAGPQRKKYEVVSVNGDSEMEQFQN